MHVVCSMRHGDRERTKISRHHSLKNEVERRAEKMKIMEVYWVYCSWLSEAAEIRGYDQSNKGTLGMSNIRFPTFREFWG